MFFSIIALTYYVLVDVKYESEIYFTLELNLFFLQRIKETKSSEDGLNPLMMMIIPKMQKSVVSLYIWFTYLNNHFGTLTKISKNFTKRNVSSIIGFRELLQTYDFSMD